MERTGESIERIEALRALLDRLGSPDLSLGEAKAVRCRLFNLTGRAEGSVPICEMDPQAVTSSIPCEGHEHGSRSLACRNCAA